MIRKNENALLVVDVQNDFCPGGNLAVKEGDVVVGVINPLMEKFFRVIATQDWHPANHRSFASGHPGKNIYDLIDLQGVEQVLWPDHCVAGSRGAEFHPALDQTRFDLILRKGTNPLLDSYSAFLENNKKTKTGLDGYLTGLGIRQIFLCGLATDYCVFFSALDGVALGFETIVILNGCRGVDVPPGNVEKSIAVMRDRGVKIIRSTEI